MAIGDDRDIHLRFTEKESGDGGRHTLGSHGVGDGLLDEVVLLVASLLLVGVDVVHDAVVREGVERLLLRGQHAERNDDATMRRGESGLRLRVDGAVFLEGVVVYGVVVDGRVDTALGLLCCLWRGL